MPKKKEETKKEKDLNKVNKKAAKKTSTKKATTKKAVTKKSTRKIKSVTEKKKTTQAKKKTTAKKTQTRKTTKSSVKKIATKKAIPAEFYDLPYRYNQTIVKVLAQTPKMLFVYWDISDKDKENYKKQYGENFFEKSRPVLLVHNDTLNYTFQVDINDFANSWYVHINDSNSDYRVELGRIPIEYNEKVKDNYVYVTTSNEMESPNDHILFEKMQNEINFRNVKTGFEETKNIARLKLIPNLGRIYNIYELYKQIYKDENIEDFSNPSSSSSSTFR